ncbi:hypothetical protein B6V72_17905 [Thioclava sp. F34-6]|nr:hypothetical protein B6V72_17905 [Thioclava sp. F34-6]
MGMLLLQSRTSIRSLLRSGAVFPINGRMRDELLNETMFRNLAHARIVIAAWAADYNTERPHSALDYQTPADYARALTSAIARPAARNAGFAIVSIVRSIITRSLPRANGMNCLPTNLLLSLRA